MAKLFDFLKSNLNIKSKRRAALRQAVEAYLRRLTPEKLKSGEAYEPLEKLAQRFEEHSLNPLEVYREAFKANPQDLRVLKIIVRDIIKTDQKDKESLNYLRLIAERDEDKFPYLQALAARYREADQPYQLMLTYEKIIDTYNEYKRIAKKTKKRFAIDWDEAEVICQEAKSYLVELYLQMGRKDSKALRLFRETFERDADRVDVLELMAQAYIERGSLANEALEVYEWHLAYAPDNKETRLLLAQGYCERSRAPEAIVLLEEYYRRHREDTDFLREVVKYYLKSQGINERSIGYIKELAKRRPDDKELAGHLAHYYAGMDSLEKEAIAFYQKALSQGAREPKFYLLLGNHFYKDQDYLQAMEYLEHLYREGDMSKEVLVPLARIYAEFDRTDAKAMAVYERVFQRGIPVEKLRELMCCNYLQAQRTDAQAVNCYREVLSRHPRHIEARKGLCLYHRDQNDFAALIPETIELLKIAPTCPEAIDLLAAAITNIYDKSIAQQIKVLDKAVQRRVLEQAFRVRPENQLIAKSLSQLYVEVGYSGDLAEKVLGYAYQLEPDNLLLLNTLVQLYHERGDKDKPFIYGKRIYQQLKKKQSLNDQEKRIFDNLCLTLTRIYLREKFPLKVFSEEEQENILTQALVLGMKEPRLIVELAERAATSNDCSPRALELYQQAITIAPDNEELRNQFINTCLALKKPEPLIDLALNALEKSPGDKKALELLINCLDRFDHSSLPLISKLEELYAYAPNNERLCLALALAYSNQEVYDIHVLKILERAAYIQTSDVKLLRALADCHAALGDFSKAKFTYQRLLWIVPDDEDLTLKLAHCFQQLAEMTMEAKRIVEQALSFKPDNLELHLYNLRLVKGLGSREELVRRFNRLIDIFPDQLDVLLKKHISILDSVAWPPELTLKIVKLDVQLGNFDQALKELGRISGEYTKYYSDLLDIYNLLLDKDPENITALSERGVLFKLTENYEDAIADLEKAHSLDPDNENIVYELAEVYNGHLKHHDYQDVAALAKLGQFYWQLEEYDECIAIYQKLLAQEKESTPALLALARSFQKKGALEMALQYYKRLPKDQEILPYLEELAEEFYAAGKIHSAIDTLNEIVSYDISYHDAVEKLAELQKELYGQAEVEPLFPRIMAQLGKGARERFELLEEIGRGAWSLVFKAYDKEIGEIVALKILPEQFSENQEAVERLKGELKVTRKLAHPGIVRLYDIGEEKGRKYLSMEYVDGGDLKKLMARGSRLTQEEFFHIALQIAEALAHAHSNHVLHLDIKPANILLTRKREVKLTDFGIAGVLAQAQQTTSDIIVGTPLYMSPEQAEGKACSVASDIYSFGVVMYEMLAGAPPFTMGNITYHHIFTRPREIKGIKYSLQRLIMKCLEKAPQNRYSGSEEIRDELIKLRNALVGK